MHFTLVRITTPHMPDTRVFDDVLLPLKYALESLGYEAETRVNVFNPGSRNICLGANYDPALQWIRPPDGTILLNLEQLEAEGYPWLADGAYLDLLRRFETWDFSLRNVDYLKSRGIEAAFLPLGYVPEMSRLAPCPDPLTDGLFYGAITPRRRQVLDALDARGLKILRLEKAFGDERDQALYRTRLLINIHHSLPASLEIVRLGYALANRRAVVSELAPDTYHYPELAGACAYGLKGELPALAAELAADEAMRERQARQGFESFADLRLDRALAELVGRRPGAVGSRSAARLDQDEGPTARPDCDSISAAPSALNIGSGPHFLTEALNIDADESQRPDLVMAFPAGLDRARIYPTVRFGNISLGEKAFKRIYLGAVSAWNHQAGQLLNACRELLADDGHLIITLPADSLNENSLRDFAAPAPNAAGLAGTGDAAGRPPAQAGGDGGAWAAPGFTLESRELLMSERGRMLLARGLEPEAAAAAEGALTALRFVLRKGGEGLRPDEAAALRAAAASALARPSNAGQDSDRAIYELPAPLWLVDDPRDEAGYPPRPSFPPPKKMRRRLAALTLKRLRYRFNLRLNLSGRHDRYREKLAAVEREIAELRRLLDY